MKRTLLILLVTLSACVGQAAETIRLLTIGNSFTANSTRYLEEISTAGGCTLIHEMVSLAGCSMEQHWGTVEAHRADPADPKGNPYDGKNLKEIIQSDTWDIITIQQLSRISTKVETYRPYAQNLYDFIKKHAPQAEVRIHQTWAYRADDTSWYTNGRTQEDMHADIHASYHTIARELGITLIPVGEAFANARNHPDWNLEHDPSYDYENPAYPDVANEKQSLNRGPTWRMKNGEWSYWSDTHHAGPLGEYLGGAIFFESLFGKSIIGNSYVPPNLSAKDIAFLQQIANNTMENPKNIVP